MKTWSKISHTRKAAVLAVLLSGCMYGLPVTAANLVATVPSDYSSSQLGMVTGSRVTTNVDAKVQVGAIKDLNRDPGVYAFNHNGKSEFALRQYTYSTTDLEATQIFSASSSNLTTPNQKGIISAVPNMHAASANKNFVFATGYDLGKIGVAKIDGNKLTEVGNVSTATTLMTDIKAHCNGQYTNAKACAHGESIMAIGNDVYVVASVNPTGGYDPYDDSYLMHYTVDDKGILTFADYARIGKNNDQARINLYNNKLLVTSIGGMQNYGYGNADTAIHVVSMDNGKLAPENSQKITVPSNVQYDFRDLKVLPNGTAYVLTYNLSATSAGMSAKVYKTTISNLVSENPKNWEEVVSGDYDGWFGKIYADYYTKRLWFEDGNALTVYTDGSANKPTHKWEATAFSTNSQYYQFNSVVALDPDTVAGETAKLTTSLPKTVNSNGVIDPKADYYKPITGTAEDSAYASVTSDNKNYVFDADKIIYLKSNASGDLTTNVLADIDAHNGNDITVNAGSHALQLQALNYVASPSGIYAGNGKNVTVNAGKVNIITASYDGGNSLTNAIWNDAPASGSSNITINAPVNISMSGGNGGNGIAIEKTDRWGEASNASNASSKIVINGNATIAGADNETWGIPVNLENVYSRFNNSGILTSVDNSEVDINGNVDFAVYGNGVTTNAVGSKVKIDGGKIVVPKGMNYGYYTLAAFQGDIDMNTGADGTTPGSNDVKLDGDIFTLKTGKVNVALTTADSYLNGIVDNGGTANLWLQNGAQWTNNAQNSRYSEDNEDVGAGQVSHVSKLVGGSDAAHAGVIYQKAASDLTIDNFSGNAMVIYAHDSGTPSNITGGNTKITSAASGSGIVMRTDNSGIDVANKDTVNSVLDALAKKLYYINYATENNLSGTVQIAEGLTASAVAATTSTISFDSTTGQGSRGISSDPQSKSDFTTTITGADDKEYTDANVEKKTGIYTFTKDSTLTANDTNTVTTESGMTPAVVTANVVNDAGEVTIDAKGKNLSLESTSQKDDKSYTAGIVANNNMTIGAKNLKILALGNDTDSIKGGTVGIYVNNTKNSGNNVNITGDVTINAYDRGNGKSYGILVNPVNDGGASTLTINGNLTMKGENDTSKDKNDGIYGVGPSEFNGNGKPGYGIDLNDQSTAGGSKININGKADLAIDGTGVLVTGNVNNVINIREGNIVTRSASARVLSAVKGTINMGMNEDATSSNGKDVNVTGIVYASTDGTINLGLDSKDSLLTGNIMHKDDTTGTANLYLGSGTWNNVANTNKTFTGSKVNKLVGGKTAATHSTIFQNDTHPITIDDYSGNSMVIYAHDSTTPTTIIGGDTKITKAETGSNITLMTDNTGLNTASTNYKDKNLVSATLNALANKLYYTAYTSGEKNLDGTVEIAEGLTATSASMQTGAITFKDADGQGQYVYTPAVPDTQETTDFTTPVTGYLAKDEAYINAGILKRDTEKYEFTKDTTNITTNITEKADKISAGAWMPQIAAAVYNNQTGTKDTTLNLHGNKLNVNNTSNAVTAGITSIGKGSKVEINDAGAMNVSAKSTGGSMTAGIYVNNGGEIDIHNGGNNKENKILTVRADTSNVANGAVIKSMNGVNGVTSNINIDGLVDVLADGDTTDGFGANEAVSAVASTINIGGGTIKAINGAWAAIRAYGEFVSSNTGTVNVNVTKDANGKANGADDNKTVIEGDIVTNGGMGTKGCISVGLSTDDSYWLGNYADTRGYGVTQGQLGAVNLFMKNGSHWKGFGNGTMNVQMEGAGTNWTGFNIGDNMQLTLKDGAIWHNAITADQKDQDDKATNAKIKYLTSDKGVIDMTGANVFVASSTSLTGASTSGKNSSITESTNGITGNVVVDNYSGNSTVIYAHDAATPNVMKGGNFTITKAAEGSKITMLTDNSGVDNTDDDSINATLDALAKKLYYTAYTTGERNLTGAVEIAEGLTASSAIKQTGVIAYDDTTGEGSLKTDSVTPGAYYPESQDTDKFSTAITGDMSLDKEYLRTGVLRKDTGKYEFTKPSTTITTTGRNTYGGDHWLLVHANLGVYGDDSSKTTTLNLHDNALTVNMTSPSTVAAVAAVGGKTKDDYMNGKYGSVEINNPGAITINAKSTDGGMTAAVFANGGGHVTIHNGGENQENKILTARAETSTATNGAVIKTMNGNRSTNSNITIDGLVDVLADGDTSDGFGANEAVSAVASTINIGGGTIKAINGAWAAIRAYGEFVSSNTGTVNVNVTKDEKGNANGAGTNKTVIEGDFVTNGGMGTKGCISVGLSTDDSYWLGNYADTRGYGVTQGQLGAVNLFMKNGSNWKGFGNGTMNVQMEGAGTNWTGFNVGDNMQLTLKDGAIWHNAITADQKDRNGDVVPAKVKYLTSDKGVIDMTGANVFVASSSSLSGPTSGKSSSITESTNGITGNVVVDNYSGNSTVIYAHDAATPNVMKGGNFTITKAAEGSKITMLTDNSGVDLMEESSINDTLDALAKKLFYTAYTTGERNLTGTVEIAEGLTSTSATKETGNIVYDSTTGEGSLDKATVKPGPIYPDNQNAETYSNVITGDYSKDEVYKKSGVMKKDSTYQFTKANTAIVLNPAGEAVVDAQNYDVNMYLNNNNMTLKNTFNNADKVTTGIRALNGKNVTINNSGNLTIDVANSKGLSTGIKADKGIVRIHNGKNAVTIDKNKVTSTLTTSLTKDLNLGKGSLIALDAENGGQIILDGTVKSTSANVGLVADKGSISAGGVDLSGVTTGLAAANGGNIVTGATKITAKNGGNAAVAENGGNISMGAEGADSTINGNIKAENASTINAILATSGSSFTGAVAKDADSKVNMTLKNKALWNNTGTKDTEITSLTGGDTTGTAGAIRQKSANALNIGNLSGNVEVIYSHDSANPTSIDGGNVTVTKATKTNGTNAGILVSTDNTGINTSDTASVKNTLNALANKITYSAAISGENNLNGKVQIAEGLTANSASQKVGKMAFSSTTGQGSLVATSISSNPDILYGPKETAMMRGAKSAMLSSAMIWRSENDDLMQRMENLRVGNEDAGIWARMYAGKQDYNNGTTDLENNYRTYQVGFDKNVGHGWRVGVAASYNDGSSTYELNGRGDQSATSGSLYGTWIGDKGHYFGLQLKGSKIRNNYTAYNDMGHKLTGDYDTWAESMTAEYGRRISLKNGTWIEPQAKFSLGHINSSDYNANSDFLNSDGTNKDMSVSQDAYNSAIGRIGLGYGFDVNNFNAYARVLLAHEFGGAFTSSFSATGEPESGTRVDLGDTWTEVQIGFSKKFNKTSSGYASFEKSFGGDLQDRWRVDAGLRFTF